MALRIAQLTDLHLYRDPSARLAGVQTWDTFRKVMGLVEEQRIAPDYLILTGDLAQDEALETYQMLREELGDWVERCRIIPGNHDDRGNLRKAFPELFPDREGPLTFSMKAGGWRIIGLDSQLPGSVKGRVDGDQLMWLKNELLAAPGAPAIVFIHHPPMPIDVLWLDKIGLHEAQELIDTIVNTPEIRLVCAGHVHQEFAGHIGTADLYTTPSSCVQFSAHAERTFDTRMAGYRLITLNEDSHHTEVFRLH